MLPSNGAVQATVWNSTSATQEQVLLISVQAPQVDVGQLYVRRSLRLPVIWAPVQATVPVSVAPEQTQLLATSVHAPQLLVRAVEDTRLVDGAGQRCRATDRAVFGLAGRTGTGVAVGDPAAPAAGAAVEVSVLQDRACIARAAGGVWFWVLGAQVQVLLTSPQNRVNCGSRGIADPLALLRDRAGITRNRAADRAAFPSAVRRRSCWP